MRHVPIRITDILWSEVVDQGRTFRCQMCWIPSYALPDIVHCCDTGLMPRIIDILTKLDRKAAQERKRKYPGSQSPAEPFHVTSLERVEPSADGNSISAIFNVADGFPIAVSIASTVLSRALAPLRVQLNHATNPYDSDFELTGAALPLRFRRAVDNAPIDIRAGEKRLGGDHGYILDRHRF